MELADARQRLRDRLEDESVTDAKLDVYLNDAAQELGQAFDWPWLLREFSLSTRGVYTSADATFTKGSRVVSLGGALASTPFGHTMIANNRVMRVANVESSATKIHLESTWPDPDGTYDVTFLNDEIALPRGVKSVQMLVMHDASTVPQDLTSLTAQEMRWLQQDTTGTPAQFSTYRRATLPAPQEAPTYATGGTGLTGVYKYWQTYWDPATGGESRLSPALTTTSLSNVTVTLTPDTRQDFGVRFYRSRAGGSTPYFLSEQTSPTATYQDNRGDDYLGDRVTDEPQQLYVRLHPVPDAVYQITAHAIILPPAMKADTDTQPFPEEDVPTWLRGAEAVALRATKEWQAAALAKQDFMAGIASMKQRHVQNRVRPWIMGGSSRRPRRMVIDVTTS
jgi:hypothetical protein